MKRSTVPAAGVQGPARVGQDTARLLRRLEPGDVAVLDVIDLDSATASALVARKVVAVVNAAPSTSGRYPNLGPRVLLDAGIPLVDAVGDELLAVVRDGKPLRVQGGVLWQGDHEVARGSLQDEAAVEAAVELATAGLSAQLAALTSSATGFLLDERDLLLEGVGVPRLTADLAGRHVLVVADAYAAAEELALLKAYRREHKPFLVGVDGGADLLLRHGLRPDAVVGDLSVVSDKALTRAGELVGRVPVPTSERPVIPFRTSADSLDMALLVAARGGAAVVVAVGAPTTVEQVLDRGRSGSASALLVRLGLLDQVVGARAAAALSPASFPLLALLLLVVAVVAVGLVAWTLTGGSVDLGLLRDRWDLPW